LLLSQLGRALKLKSSSSRIGVNISTISTMSKYQEQVKSLVAEHPVMVFSKSYCPFCRETKRTLDQLNVKHYDIELDLLDIGEQLQRALYEITSQRTVPAIFIDGKFVGGNSDLQALKNKGGLKTMLDEAGIPAKI